MRRALITALCAVLLLAVPASAQLFPPDDAVPSPEPVAPSERVLVDAVLRVNPPRQEGLCMVMGAGMLAVTVRRVADAPVESRPARFSFSGLMADPEANIETPINNQDVTVSTRINGAGHYCWDVSIDAPETESMPNYQRGAYVQRIAVKMTLTQP